MGTVIYTGGAANVADVINITPGGTIEVGDIFKVTIGISTVQIAASATTIASVCTDLQAALSSGDAPLEFQDLTWELNSTVTPTYIIGTGPSDGRPIYASLSVATTEAGGGAADAQTIAKSNPTPGTGSLDWNNVDNWDTGAVPATNDKVWLGVYGIVPQYNLSHAAVTNIELHVVSTSQAGLLVGLPKQNANGFVEYLGTELLLGAFSVQYGEGLGASVPSLRLNTGTQACDVYVYKSGSRDGDGQAPFLWLCNSTSSNVKECYAALDIAKEPGQTSSLGTIAQGAGSDIELGEGVVLATSITVNGGSLVSYAIDDPTLIDMKVGTTVTLFGRSGDVTTIKQQAGSTLNWRRATGTVTNYTSVGGTVDFTNVNSTSAVAFTNVDLYAGASWNDPNGYVTTTNGINLNLCGIGDVSVIVGKNQKIEMTAL